eukprot:4621167-Alexandrium_andersonii.AAC.1
MRNLQSGGRRKNDRSDAHELTVCVRAQRAADGRRRTVRRAKSTKRAATQTATGKLMHPSCDVDSN